MSTPHLAACKFVRENVGHLLSATALGYLREIEDYANDGATTTHRIEQLRQTLRDTLLRAPKRVNVNPIDHANYAKACAVDSAEEAVFELANPYSNEGKREQQARECCCAALVYEAHHKAYIEGLSLVAALGRGSAVKKNFYATLAA